VVLKGDDKLKLHKLKNDLKESIRKVLKAVIITEQLTPYTNRDVDLIDVCVQLLLELDNETKKVEREARKSKKDFDKKLKKILENKP